MFVMGTHNGVTCFGESSRARDRWEVTLRWLETGYGVGSPIEQKLSTSIQSVGNEIRLTGVVP